ncbi:unnamed protein product [Ambrosiozyma monospora]|uniref:Unnamed protein product n=1 Tax=Ambrosiozyma monospora TaxID=43982 RepID=A0ACB5TFJ0_AMBMO|nr:unnamed protein product [Ambrosiozyma monospora]
MKEVIVSYLNSRHNQFDKWPTNSSESFDHDMVAQFVSMLGYTPLFDTLLSMAIQEVGLAPSIFSSIHFNEFVNFVFSRSLHLKSLTIVTDLEDDTIPYSDPDILRLLNLKFEISLPKSRVCVFQFH